MFGNLFRRQSGPDLPDEALTEVVLRPVGVVRSRIRDARYRDTAHERADLVIEPDLAPALAGLDGFSHAIVITWLHDVDDCERIRLTMHPAGDRALPEVGAFALRAQQRPNPIGVTVVSIDSVRNGIVRVIGLDAMDGTPVLDIKPYIPHYDSVPAATLPGWAMGESG